MDFWIVDCRMGIAGRSHGGLGIAGRSHGGLEIAGRSLSETSFV